MASLGYQPPFLDYPLQEVAVPSVWANLLLEKHMEAGSLRSPSPANHYRVPAPVYRPGQTHGCPRTTFRSRSDQGNRYVGAFRGGSNDLHHGGASEFPATLKVHPTFHVSQIKPVLESEFGVGLELESFHQLFLLPFELLMGARRTRSIALWMCVGGVECGSF